MCGGAGRVREQLLQVLENISCDGGWGGVD